MEQLGDFHDLILRLLEFLPDQRLSAAAARAHRFVAHINKRADGSSPVNVNGADGRADGGPPLSTTAARSGTTSSFTPAMAAEQVAREARGAVRQGTVPAGSHGAVAAAAHDTNGAG